MADLSNTFELTLSGMDGVRKAFESLKPNLAERVGKIAVRQGANYLAKQIRAAAPQSPAGSREKIGPKQYATYPRGRLKRAIKVRQSKFNRLGKNGVIGYYITVAKGKKRSDPKGAWYGGFVEGGYTIGSRTISAQAAVREGIITQAELNALRKGKKTKKGNQERIRNRSGRGTRRIEGQHFVRRAFNAHAEQTATIIAESAKNAFLELARKQGLNTN
jgi:hypothetical protein